MGVVGEAALPAAGVGIAEAGEPMRRVGDGEQVVGDGFGAGIEFEEEALFAALDMLRGGAVAKAEAIRFIDDVEDAAAVDGPEAEAVRLDGDDFAGLDLRFRIGDADPAKVEVAPLAQGGFGGFEGGDALADPGAHAVEFVEAGDLDLAGAELRVERGGVV